MFSGPLTGRGFGAMLIGMAPPSTAPRMQDPALEALANAPYDAEPVTEEEEHLVEEGREAVRRGEVLTTDELIRSLGL
jgi:hypothetical protein